MPSSYVKQAVQTAHALLQSAAATTRSAETGKRIARALKCLEQDPMFEGEPDEQTEKVIARVEKVLHK